MTTVKLFQKKDAKAPPMKVSADGKLLLRELEGVREYEYLCTADKRTIGVGCQTDGAMLVKVTDYTLVTKEEITIVED